MGVCCLVPMPCRAERGGGGGGGVEGLGVVVVVVGGGYTGFKPGL